MCRAGGNTAYDHAKILRIGNAVERNNSAVHCLLQCLFIGLIAGAVDIAGGALILFAVA